jgi:lipopolysaccharide biosynthesis protein
VIGSYHAFVGNLRRLQNQVRRTWAGSDPLPASRSEAVYVHYDRNGVIHDYVLEQLRAIVAAGFRITFVSNSPSFSEKNVSEIASYCSRILWRRNVGHDFGAYKDGVRAIGNLDRVDRLLLMNDSVYGPFHSLAHILAAIDPAGTDFWGISDSWEYHYHIQSYFLLFLRGALQSSAFQQFWQKLPYVTNRDWVIQNGEIKLSQRLIQFKLRASVLVPYWKVAKVVMDKISRLDTERMVGPHKDFLDRTLDIIVRGTPVNPSHHFWEAMISDFGCPFLKRDLITRNPAEIPFTWRWDEVISRYSDYDLSLIERHLRSS